MNHNEVCADNDHESFIAEVFDETENWTANAQLIAAAPDMLNALHVAANTVKAMLLRETPDAAEFTEHEWVLETIHNVIAQATKSS